VAGVVVYSSSMRTAERYNSTAEHDTLISEALPELAFT
jgi:hypothetical protein